MRLFKLIIFLLVAGFVALFIYQNLSTFNSIHAFILNLKFRAPVQWSMKVYEIMLFAALAGFLVGIFLLVKPWLNTRRLLAKERKEKSSLNEQLQSYQGYQKPEQETGEASKATEESKPAEKSPGKEVPEAASDEKSSGGSSSA